MDADQKYGPKPAPERSEAFWRRVYLSVVAVTFVVITALWAFSRYFA